MPKVEDIKETVKIVEIINLDPLRDNQEVCRMGSEIDRLIVQFQQHSIFNQYFLKKILNQRGSLSQANLISPSFFNLNLPDSQQEDQLSDDSEVAPSSIVTNNHSGRSKSFLKTIQASEKTFKKLLATNVAMLTLFSNFDVKNFNHCKNNINVVSQQSGFSTSVADLKQYFNDAMTNNSFYKKSLSNSLTEVAFKNNSDGMQGEFSDTHPVLKQVVDELRSIWPEAYDFTITDIHRTKQDDGRLGGSGVHVHKLENKYHRAIDVRTNIFDSKIRKQVSDLLTTIINQKFLYNKNKKNNVAVNKKHGSGPHIHLQIDSKTGVRSNPDIEVINKARSDLKKILLEEKETSIFDLSTILDSFTHSFSSIKDLFFTGSESNKKNAEKSTNDFMSSLGFFNTLLDDVKTCVPQSSLWQSNTMFHQENNKVDRYTSKRSSGLKTVGPTKVLSSRYGGDAKLLQGGAEVLQTASPLLDDLLSKGSAEIAVNQDTSKWMSMFTAVVDGMVEFASDSNVSSVDIVKGLVQRKTTKKSSSKQAAAIAGGQMGRVLKKTVLPSMTALLGNDVIVEGNEASNDVSPGLMELFSSVVDGVVEFTTDSGVSKVKEETASSQKKTIKASKKNKAGRNKKTKAAKKSSIKPAAAIAGGQMGLVLKQTVLPSMTALLGNDDIAVSDEASNDVSPGLMEVFTSVVDGVVEFTTDPAVSKVKEETASSQKKTIKASKKNKVGRNKKIKAAKKSSTKPAAAIAGGQIGRVLKQTVLPSMTALLGNDVIAESDEASNDVSPGLMEVFASVVDGVVEFTTDPAVSKVKEETASSQKKPIKASKKNKAGRNKKTKAAKKSSTKPAAAIAGGQMGRVLKLVNSGGQFLQAVLPSMTALLGNDVIVEGNEASKDVSPGLMEVFTSVVDGVVEFTTDPAVSKVKEEIASSQKKTIKASKKNKVGRNKKTKAAKKSSSKPAAAIAGGQIGRVLKLVNSGGQFLQAVLPSMTALLGNDVITEGDEASNDVSPGLMEVFTSVVDGVVEFTTDPAVSKVKEETASSQKRTIKASKKNKVGRNKKTKAAKKFSSKPAAAIAGGQMGRVLKLVNSGGQFLQAVLPSMTALLGNDVSTEGDEASNDASPGLMELFSSVVDGVVEFTSESSESGAGEKKALLQENKIDNSKKHRAAGLGKKTKTSLLSKMAGKKAKSGVFGQLLSMGGGAMKHLGSVGKVLSLVTGVLGAQPSAEEKDKKDDASMLPTVIRTAGLVAGLFTGPIGGLAISFGADMLADWVESEDAAEADENKQSDKLSQQAKKIGASVLTDGKKQVATQLTGNIGKQANRAPKTLQTLSDIIVDPVALGQQKSTKNMSKMSQLIANKDHPDSISFPKISTQQYNDQSSLVHQVATTNVANGLAPEAANDTALICQKIEELGGRLSSELSDLRALLGASSGNYSTADALQPLSMSLREKESSEDLALYDQF